MLEELKTKLEQEIERLREDSGEERYRSSPLLRTMVKEGKKFFE